MDIDILLYIIINPVVNQSLFVENYPPKKGFAWLKFGVVHKLSTLSTCA